jgi:hypothetical protein
VGCAVYGDGLLGAGVLGHGMCTADEMFLSMLP